ncbi:ABC transporter ATP-binding protein [uncultured Corynebacterium sp.]|uniref:ATP-binding cassette domain-containing protein n=1 Tax=uncultured Corynebacterium sp. TaxID=159447 RepID=UPI002639734E|nr:ABC transporter ATP-binding protein [uncultured Corynebacterium sp.]
MSNRRKFSLTNLLSYCRYIGAIVRSAKLAVSVAFWAAITSAVANIAILFATKALIDAVVGSGKDAGHVALILAVLALAMFAAKTMPRIQNVAVERANTGFLKQQFDDLHAALYGSPTLEVVEDPKMRSTLETVSNQLVKMSGSVGVGPWFKIFNARLSALCVTGVVLAWNPLIAVALIGLMWWAAATWESYGEKAFASLYDSGSQAFSHATWYNSLLTDWRNAGEARVWGIRSLALSRFSQLWHEAVRPMWEEQDKQLRAVYLSSGVASTFVVGCWLWSIHGALTGALTVGSCIMLIQAVDQMGLWGPVGGDAEIRVAQHKKRWEELRRMRHQAEAGADGKGSDRRRGKSLNGYGGDVEARSRQVAPEATVGEAGAIHVRELTFGYPGGPDVLKSVSFDVQPGEVVGVVGKNGCGKSTLVKLLCGLYKPEAGTIEVGGNSPGECVAERKLAVVHQQGTRLPLTVVENVTIGAGVHGSAADAARDALELAGSPELMHRTGVLDISQSEGSSLSGGQWQRIGLARAFVRTASQAEVLILDEPTAKLDIKMEADMYASVMGNRGKITTILVTHRLATVRGCDRIIVLDGGGIAEVGTHDQLMHVGGIYAEAFNTQATLLGLGESRHE